MPICTVHDLNSEGEGVASLEGYTLFIEGALPEEEVEVTLFERKRRFGRAQLIKILKQSPHRIDPPCPIYDRCGGCQIMHLNYPQQLEAKKNQVEEALKRIGKLTCTVLPCTPSPHPFHYRNKLQYAIRYQENPHLTLDIGMLARGSHDLVPIEKCLIHSSQGEIVYQTLLPLLKEAAPPFLRYLILKNDGALVILVTSTPTPFTELGQAILNSSPLIKGVVQNVNPAQSNRVLADHYIPLAGEDRIIENILGIEVSLSAASFFQVNQPQAEALYHAALKCANLTGEESILDAYCGVGALTLLFAQKAKNAIGIECVPQAIEDAKANAVRNQITNVQFICDFAEKAVNRLKNIDIAILNPPRKGCESLFLERLIKLKPQTILYISCNPTTLARDLHLLVTAGYQIELVQPFDMFAQTAHVETLVKLSRHTPTSPKFQFSSRWSIDRGNIEH